MGLTMTNNSHAGSTISNKKNLHSILNHQVNYDALQPNLSSQIMKTVISTNNTDQQEPNNKEFDRYVKDSSSDSSNDSKSVEEGILIDKHGDAIHLKKSPTKVSIPHIGKSSY